MSKGKILVSVAIIGLIAAVAATGVVLAIPPKLTHYVALGDSIAGGQGATVQERFGYVPLFYKTYKKDHRGPERITTYEENSVDSSSIIDVQLGNALQVIGSEDSDVEVVTLTVGGNDFLPLTSAEPCASDPAGQACQLLVGKALLGFSGNYQTILTQLTEARASDSGDEKLLVTTYYNPYQGTGSPFEGPAHGALFGLDGTVDCAAMAADPRNGGVNDLITCIGGQFGARVVDLYPLFAGKALELTHISEGDIHPNDAGYRVIADAVIAAYSAP